MKPVLSSTVVSKTVAYWNCGVPGCKTKHKNEMTAQNHYNHAKPDSASKQPKAKALVLANSIRREFQVLESILNGKTLAAIALKMGVSPAVIRRLCSRTIHSRLKGLSAGGPVPADIWRRMNLEKGGYTGYRDCADFWRERMRNYTLDFNKRYFPWGVSIKK